METLGERVKAEREAKPWSQQRLADEVTKAGFEIGQSAIGNIESGRVKEPKSIVQLAAALGVSPRWLQTGKGDKAASAPSRSASGLAEVAAPPPIARMTPVDLHSMPADIPVWASAQAGDDGAIILVPDPIDYIRRSERMQGVKNPFAFQIVGSSMSPALEHGDQAVVNPVLLPRPGADCVFIQQQEDNSFVALVKRLLKQTPDIWRARQFNPAKDFDLPRRKWSRVHVIAEIRRGGL